LESQWERIDRPVPEAVGAAEGDVGAAVGNVDALTVSLGDEFSSEVVLASVSRLVRAGYLNAIDAHSAGGDYWLEIQLAERGRRAIGSWPSNELGAALLAVLDERIAEAEGPEERSRWLRLRDGAAGVGQGVLGGVLVEAAKRGLAL
jgi:hypothetical protein